MSQNNTTNLDANTLNLFESDSDREEQKERTLQQNTSSVMVEEVEAENDTTTEEQAVGDEAEQVKNNSENEANDEEEEAKDDTADTTDKGDTDDNEANDQQITEDDTSEKEAQDEEEQQLTAVVTENETNEEENIPTSDNEANEEEQTANKQPKQTNGSCKKKSNPAPRRRSKRKRKAPEQLAQHEHDESLPPSKNLPRRGRYASMKGKVCVEGKTRYYDPIRSDAARKRLVYHGAYEQTSPKGLMKEDIIWNPKKKRFVNKKVSLKARSNEWMQMLNQARNAGADTFVYKSKVYARDVTETGMTIYRFQSKVE